jgi:hypothetical protein
MKGPAAEEEILGGGDVIKDRGFVISESHTYFLPRNKGERRLVMISSAEGP